MKLTLQAIIPLIIIYLIISYFDKRSSEVSFVKSKVDDKTYLVRNGPDKQRAADLLADINKRLTTLIKKLHEKYPNKPEVQRLVDKFDPDNLSEGSNNSGYTTYTVNKGEKMVFCLRDRNGTNELHDINTLMFVALHELGHIATKDFNGHDEVFKKNFKFIIDEAIKMGLYEYTDYTQNPKSYCGIMITDSPAEK